MAPAEPREKYPGLEAWLKVAEDLRDLRPNPVEKLAYLATPADTQLWPRVVIHLHLRVKAGVEGMEASDFCARLEDCRHEEGERAASAVSDRHAGRGGGVRRMQIGVEQESVFVPVGHLAEGAEDEVLRPNGGNIPVADSGTPVVVYRPIWLMAMDLCDQIGVGADAPQRAQDRGFLVWFLGSDRGDHARRIENGPLTSLPRISGGLPDELIGQVVESGSKVRDGVASNQAEVIRKPGRFDDLQHELASYWVERSLGPDGFSYRFANLSSTLLEFGRVFICPIEFGPGSVERGSGGTQG